ncbi:MAG TPA: hypothetical protein VK939_04925 [Longimicrobiales bacterium]|nr:hypothetical protein [Longimicrobiales bacterium]
MLEKQFYGERVRRYTDKMARVLYDAYLKIDAEREARGLPHPMPEEVDIISWPQSWPDARCGFEEPLRDVIRSEQTDVVIDQRVHTIYVYHAGHFARRIESPGDAFWEAVRERCLPGATDEAGWGRLRAD